MFAPKRAGVDSVVDILNTKGANLAGLMALRKTFQSLDDARIGGFTCNICFRRIEPTEVSMWDSEKMSETATEAENFKFPLATAGTKATPADVTTCIDPRIQPMRSELPMVKHLCQGYFCHHRAMNGEALKLFNRCFSVCMKPSPLRSTSRITLT